MPDLAQELGGEAEVQRKVVERARNREGMDFEVRKLRKDLRDPDRAMSKEALRVYFDDPRVSLKSAHERRSKGLQTRRLGEDIAAQARRLIRKLAAYHPDPADLGDPTKLRQAMAGLITEAQRIELAATRAMAVRTA